MEFDIEKHKIYVCKHGSQAYGTSTPESDLDIKGVAIAPLDYYLGFSKIFEQNEKYVSKGADVDQVIYDLRKFFKLAADCNPNIIEVLFCNDEDVLFISDIGKILVDNRDLFISKKARWTFSGYAMSQLKRIKTHRGWLLNPPKKMPERKDFNLPIDSKMSQADIGAHEHLLSKGEKLPDHIMSLLQKEKQYANAKMKFDQYQNWESSRNKERFKLESKFGYDTKHAYHLVRLLRMGKEILEGKGVLVRRPDAKELCAIRDGEWEYDKLIEWSEDQISELDSHYEKSLLPQTAPIKKLNKLCMEMIEKFHEEK